MSSMIDEDSKFFTVVERLRLCNVHDGIVDYADLPEYLKEKLFSFFVENSDEPQQNALSHTVNKDEWLNDHIYLLL